MKLFARKYRLISLFLVNYFVLNWLWSKRFVGVGRYFRMD